MNPYLEAFWPDVHTRLISYISDALTPGLPADLRARAEEQVAISDDDGTPIYRAEVAITETWKRGLPPVWSPGDDRQPDVTVAEPEIVAIEPEPERWVEIRERSGNLVTVIEVLSRANKVERGASAYIRKQQDYLSAGVNLVAIDFLRAGQHVIMVPLEHLKPVDGVRYVICVSRAAMLHRCEIYSCPLRQRLPAIRIPLRLTDRDVPLDLQPLVDRCYENGRYWQTDFSAPLTPSLEPDDRAWIEQHLRAAGFEGPPET